MLNKSATVAIALLTGILLEVGIHAVSGRREAWDSTQFWTIGLPLALAVSVILGWRSQGTNWLWTLAIAPSQVLTMMVRSGEVGNLWPLTLAFSTILSTPFLLASYIGSRFRRAV